MILGDVEPQTVAIAAAVAVSACCIAYLAWRTAPVYLIAAAVVLAPLAGHWDEVGVPGPLSPDRILLVIALLTVLGKALLAGQLAPSRLHPRAVHWAMLIAVAVAVFSALASRTLWDNDPFFRLLQIYGVLPFLVFVTAPLVFQTERDRNVLLVALVALGGYLGLTAVLETVGPDALVFPGYILDSTVGIHADRARGPFVEAVTNGTALFTCGIAALIGYIKWQGNSRHIAATVSVLCLAGTFLTLQRSVWLATIIAAAVVVVFSRELRRFLAPALVAAGVAIALALAAVPGLAAQADDRRTDERPVWDRENTNAAAIRMIEDRPVVGFGWGKYESESTPYFRLSDDIPISRTDIHNMFLTYGVELGLIGLAAWAAAFLFGIGGAIASRAPPEVEPWRVGLLAITVFFVIVGSFVPPTVFPNLIIWTWGGLVWAAAYRPDPAGHLGLRTGPAQAEAL